MPRLCVTIVGGRNLEDRHTFGTCSPYVEVEIEGQSKRTHTVKGNRNPNWNESCEFYLREPTSAQLKFTVMDDNKTPSRAMGKYVTSVSHLAKGQKQPKEIMLKDCSSGVLHVVFHAVDFGVANVVKHPQAARGPPPVQHQPQQRAAPAYPQPPQRGGGYQQPPVNPQYTAPPPVAASSPPVPNYSQSPTSGMYPAPPQINVNVTSPQPEVITKPSSISKLATAAGKGLDVGYKGAKKALNAAGANKQ